MNLREAESQSIRDFVQQAADEGYLSGRVLDYGCGKQPYRDIVEAAGGDYHGYDRADLPASVVDKDVAIGDVNIGDDAVWFEGAPMDTILCTQVMQYAPLELLLVWWKMLRRQGGHLVLTYPTNWPEVEPEDLHRFTKSGMERLLTEAGFEIIRHDYRHGFQHDGVSFACGYGVIARA